MKKQCIIITTILLLVLTLTASTLPVAFATQQQGAFTLPILGSQSQYLWAKYSCEITDNNVQELSKILAMRQNANLEIVEYFDQDLDGQLDISDLIILKKRQANWLPSKEISRDDLGIIVLAIDYPELCPPEKLAELDLNGNTVIDECDLLLAKQAYLVNYPELRYYGGSQTVIDSINIAKQFNPSASELSFYMGDLLTAELLPGENQNVVLICNDGWVNLAEKQPDGTFIREIIDEGTIQQLGLVDTATDWYAVIE